MKKILKEYAAFFCFLHAQYAYGGRRLIFCKKRMRLERRHSRLTPIIRVLLSVPQIFLRNCVFPYRYFMTRL